VEQSVQYVYSRIIKEKRRLGAGRDSDEGGESGPMRVQRGGGGNRRERERAMRTRSFSSGG
jgi:hypothetical protein